MFRFMTQLVLKCGARSESNVPTFDCTLTSVTCRMSREPKYEEQFTAFVDLLGFAEAVTAAEGARLAQVLNMLRLLAEQRGESDYIVDDEGRRIMAKPAVSVFSDHIVVSYPLQPIETDRRNHGAAAFVVEGHFSLLLARMAASALEIGFLIRGGATIGKLYHANGVVFGEALVDAFRLESRTSVYPRVTMSKQLVERRGWFSHPDIRACDQDGLWYFNYVQELLLGQGLRYSAIDDSDRKAKHKDWYTRIVGIIDNNMIDLMQAGKLQEFSKWAWLASKIRAEIFELLDKRPFHLENAGLTKIPYPLPPDDVVAAHARPRR
jgi:hypothetical protein